MTIGTPDRQDRNDAAFELKASGFTLPVLELRETDMDAISRQLGVRVRQAPDFFHNAPIVIDLQRLREMRGGFDFARLIGTLRGYGMIPVGVRGGTREQNEMAGAFELAVLGEARAAAQGPDRQPRREAEDRPAGARAEDRVRSRAREMPGATDGSVVERPAEQVEAVAVGGAQIITGPVRSGQRIFTKNGDLIVLSSVSSGAELIAEGNIHVYGVLRGRALAGVNGDAASRIFCLGLQAELVSIAGTYRVSEDIEDSVRSVPVQIFLDGKRLRIYPL